MAMKWTSKEDDAIRVCIEKHMMAHEIIDVVAALGVRRTANAISCRAYQLGLERPMQSEGAPLAQMDDAFRAALEAAHPDRIMPFRDKGFEEMHGICPSSAPARLQGDLVRSAAGCALA